MKGDDDLGDLVLDGRVTVMYWKDEGCDGVDWISLASFIQVGFPFFSSMVKIRGVEIPG
jgi:hypothetical protein